MAFIRLRSIREGAAPIVGVFVAVDGSGAAPGSIRGLELRGRVKSSRSLYLCALLYELMDEMADLFVTCAGDFGAIYGINFVRWPGVCSAARSGAQGRCHQADFDVDEKLRSRTSAPLGGSVGCN
jgi:hypothetical protein